MAASDWRSAATYAEIRRRAAAVKLSLVRRSLGEQCFARCSATATGLGTDATMLHLPTVPLAHCAANFAGGDARSQLRPGEFEIGAGEAGDNPRRGEADVGAIVIVTN